MQLCVGRRHFCADLNRHQPTSCERPSRRMCMNGMFTYAGILALAPETSQAIITQRQGKHRAPEIIEEESGEHGPFIICHSQREYYFCSQDGLSIWTEGGVGLAGLWLCHSKHEVQISKQNFSLARLGCNCCSRRLSHTIVSVIGC